MEANVQITPFWRVIRYGNRHYIQIFDVPSGDFKTVTQCDEKPERQGDFLVIKTKDNRSFIIYIDNLNAVAFPLFIATRVYILGHYIKMLIDGTYYYWSPEALNLKAGTNRGVMIDSGGMRTYVYSAKSQGGQNVSEVLCKYINAKK